MHDVSYESKRRKRNAETYQTKRSVLQLQQMEAIGKIN